ncbi:hypothetical protein BWZ20_12905 [Winogradskyella sp. J14-2]|uniref:tetratricopeptide repeat-containing sensor histidine kinase n=1 Tax=Winogradskyella sp. J14-2 TaxID=1936080 RepID=UPI000972E809|nr:sensor histidine kinase [Winogradskyella sp. J14-2]APY09146.1 hypothetical protein BWZ20_12905 [Winogradskyella sp. J14-2]
MLLQQSLCLSQSDSSYYYFDRITPKEVISERIKREQNSVLKNYFRLVYHSKLRNIDSIKYYLNELDTQEKLQTNLLARFTYFKAYYYRIIQNDSLSFKYHNEALKKGKKTKDTLTILAALSGLAQSYNYDEDIAYRMDYLEQLDTEAKKFKSNKYKIVVSYLKGNYYMLRDNDLKALAYYQQTLKNNFSPRDSTLFINILSNIGVLYNEVLNNPDSALFYYQKKIDIIENNKKFQYPDNYYSTYLNLGSVYHNKKNFQAALLYLHKADSIKFKENVLSGRSILKESLADTYYKLGDYKNAYHAQKEYFNLTDSINRRALAEGIAKYENQELKIKNLESEAKRIQNRNLLFGSLGVLLFSGITFLLVQKNTKRKQILAEQAKEIESQKLATVLKEQELTAVDAMIEGQEKERQRIANDLHDDLGGLMATVKLHFNALKDKDSPELFEKTNTLIEEAYQKVRSVAHAKNSGVIAKQGLLKAVENMAEKISASNKIQIDVIDYGLDNRLENSLELTLFRIIQELITNVIKHAEASEATIHLTNHDDAINIMVEDNGKGFNPNQVTKTNKGMGINSIDKRVEHLDGKMTIESEKDKGTTIIIDIPL